MDLKDNLRAEREAAYRRLQGGFPVPVAGAIWWLGLAMLGFAGVSLPNWIFLAVVSSGLIFPLAVLSARLFGNRFLSDRTAVSDLLGPAFTSMLLFWPVAISAWWTYPALVPLVLAIGMSQHWPVIGWSYARSSLFTVHAVVRAIACFVIWNWLPDGRITILPLAVAVIYALTVVAILVDSARPARDQD